MIVTVTPNPSIDRMIALAGPLERGEVLRVADAVDHLGGKGINISRACAAAGLATCAVLPAEADGAFVRGLETLGVRCAVLPPAGPIRVNLTLAEPDGTTTKLNAAGPTLSSEDLAALSAQVTALTGDWFVLAGSLPPGAPATFYADLAGALRESGRRVAVDTSGAALAAVVAGLTPRCAPSLLKPNAEELAEVLGIAAEELAGDPQRVAAAAAVLIEQGVGAVLATLGGSGAVLATSEGAWFAESPPVQVRSTVGAGDSSLFGYLVAELQGASAPERLASAVAYGSAAAGLPGTEVPTPTDVRPEEVQVRPLVGPSVTER